MKLLLILLMTVLFVGCGVDKNPVKDGGDSGAQEGEGEEGVAIEGNGVCEPETDLEFCTRLSGCGAVTDFGNCGSARSLDCGKCNEGKVCFESVCCTPDCTGRECGFDPVCGTSCGPDCAPPNTCNASGICNCIPDCSDFSCDPDPICGVSCRICSSGEMCESGTCVCAPDCDGRQCGLDPVCGKSCGTCTPPDICKFGRDETTTMCRWF